MSGRAVHPTSSTLLRSALLVGVVVTASSMLAACSSVTPAGGAGGGGGGVGATADSFGQPATAAEVKQGGSLVMALSAEPDQLDPTLSRSLYSRYVFSAMCEKLYDVDAQSHIVPQLAAALPTVSDGGKTVTIPVREGVKFADGTPFDAAAVKSTFERNLTLSGSGRKSELGPITSVDASDARTVVVHLKEPFAPLTAALTDRAGYGHEPDRDEGAGQELLLGAGVRRAVQVRHAGTAELDRPGQGPQLLRRGQGAPGRPLLPHHHRCEHPRRQLAFR